MQIAQLQTFKKSNAIITTTNFTPNKMFSIISSKKYLSSIFKCLSNKSTCKNHGWNKERKVMVARKRKIKPIVIIVIKQMHQWISSNSNNMGMGTTWYSSSTNLVINRDEVERSLIIQYRIHIFFTITC